jgi:hypothetical protein
MSRSRASACSGAATTPIGRLAHHGQVDFAPPQLIDKLPAVADGQAQIDVDVAFLKARQHARQEVLGAADHADRNAVDLAVAQASQRVATMLQGRKGKLDIGQQQFAGPGQRRDAGRPVKQVQAHRLLEPLDLQRHRRGREVQVVSRPGKTAVARHQREGPELLQGHATQRAIALDFHSGHLLRYCK